jgi:hypothetical protein
MMKMKLSVVKHQRSAARAQGPAGAVGTRLKPVLRTAFTLMELMVSIGILVVIILAVGVTFSGVSRSVGMSQAVMEEMAGVRETQKLIERDLQGIDRNGFFVIRSRLNNPLLADITWRFDQISFLEGGQFSNRSGANNAAPFTDSSVASAAQVWIGQGILESANPPDGSYLPANQGALPGGVAGWQSRLPTGVVGIPMMAAGSWENRCTLMVHRTLLFPGPASGNVIQPAGNPVMAYPGIELGVAPISGNEGMAAHITSSRYSTAAITVPQVMQQIMAYRMAGEATPEYDRFSYRFRALDSVYDTEVNANPFVNGYFRTTPIVMRGVSSFRVEWTDGSIFPPTDPNGRAGQMKWYGPTLPSGGNAVGAPYGTDNGALDPNVEAMPNYGDNYVAVFSYFNRAKWPKALRISMHVANDRIGGRDFVQVVNLAQ